ncbi:glycoside hydrolase family 52 protein [Rhizosaccharibacter radicis]|uniref:Glycoside hydrolase family 52 protein n=1 Tax=Rhizosaccharibacter radicis TaxID=2782605 RepID=A0ABT1VX32_9PROT|nr:glycoside hydrolase family 52 protein [Acetobacteraceae bacterium KSS12]
MSIFSDRRASTRRQLLRASALGGAGLVLARSGLLVRGAEAAPAASGGYTPASPFFNAHHSPIGAYATFTFGYPGANGGFGIEQKLPGTQGVYVGVQYNGRTQALPFFDTAKEPAIGAYAEADVSRDFRLSSDSFTTADFRFSVYSPVRSVPDPSGARDPKALLGGPSVLGISTAGRYAIEDVLLPAVFAELVVDNSAGTSEKIAFFAVAGGGAAVVDGGVPAVSFKTGPGQSAIATDDRSAVAFTGANLSQSLLGATGASDVGGIAVTVPAGRKKTIRFAICFYRGGNATTGRVTQYWYTRYYGSLDTVIATATDALPGRIASFKKDEKLIGNSALSADQKFMLAHAIRSYYGNTAFLFDSAGTPWWTVLEGQYQYMNTFDLTVDQQFFELGMNPWTVRNELDNFIAHYSYQSGVKLPDGTTGAGGVSFTHDMGLWPAFSPDGQSNYERTNVFGTFSFMTGEQLLNWTLIAGVYVNQTADIGWLRKNADLFPQVLSSLENRDNVAAGQRDGIQSYDSTKTGASGREITTYDSVGAGLEEATGNTYLGGKSWAAYVVLQQLLTLLGRPQLARRAEKQAQRAAATLVAHVTPQGYIASNVSNGESIPIIPVIEGLVYPYFAGRPDAVSASGPYAALIGAMKTHLITVLSTGLCITSDGGWKLDSQSDNTWLSKTYLNEFVGRQVLGLDIRAVTDKADAAAVTWLTNSTSARLAWSDQIINTKAIGSEYYPRGVTGILWLQEPGT